MLKDKDILAKRIGSNLKELRKSMNLSLKDLAEATNLTPAFFSRLENGGVMPSIQSLQSVADALKVDIAYLFRQDGEKEYVIDTAEKRRFVRSKGKTYKYALLAEMMANPFMEPSLVCLPNKDKEGETEHAIHEGQEFMYVVEGTMRLTLGDQVFVLKKGDAAYWKGTVPHKGTGISKEQAITLNVLMLPGRRRRVRSLEQADWAGVSKRVLGTCNAQRLRAIKEKGEEMTVDLGLKGNTVIVVGGGSNLGKACSLALAKEGVNIVVTSRDLGDRQKVAGNQTQ